jgi:hypothetical protein
VRTSIVTPWNSETLFCTFTWSPMTTSTSTYTFLPITHPAPMRARSRICAWFQMLEPGPTTASDETSAVGCTRTPARSTM